MGEPPPKPIRQSKSPLFSSTTPASITVSVGSATVSLKTETASPAVASGSRQWRMWPELTMNGSVTTSGRDKPNFASTSATCRTAPAATSNRRGEAKFMETAIMDKSSKFYADSVTREIAFVTLVSCSLGEAEDLLPRSHGCQKFPEGALRQPGNVTFTRRPLQ